MMNNSQSEKTTFKSAWQKLENTKKLPSRIRNLITIESKEFEEKVFKEESSFVEEINMRITKPIMRISNLSLSGKFKLIPIIIKIKDFKNIDI